MNLQSRPPRLQYIMAGATRSTEVVLTDLPIPILPNIIRELRREDLIDLLSLISGNTASVLLNLGGVPN